MAGGVRKEQLATSESSISYAVARRGSAQSSTADNRDSYRRMCQRVADARTYHSTIATERKSVRAGCPAASEALERRESEALYGIYNTISLLHTAGVEELRRGRS